MTKMLWISLILTSSCLSLFGQEICQPIVSQDALSPRLANYQMHLRMDGNLHSVDGLSAITWVNSSPDTVRSVQLYMYLNAFKNTNSSYLQPGAGRMPTGELANRPAEEWGWLIVKEARQQGNEELVLEQRYIQLDDGNPDDQTVLEISLEEPILPQQSLILNLKYEAKLPKTISRVGYAEHSFHHWVHSYPKIGVYEQDINGQWGWNCHQFLPHMEFYGDHGNYDVTIEAAEEYVIGASGCLQFIETKEGVSSHHYLAQDVIDFGWVASPHLQVYEDQWEHVEIRYLYPASHERLVQRLVGAAKNGLTYLSENVGPYPYNTLTILDPPIYGLRSGFMEYPTYITGGAFAYWPKSIRSIESLIIHEFAHQYFMQMLASNEKEEPWLDEGFVTFYEDCIMEASYGKKASLTGAVGYNVPNSAFTRNEYTSLSNPRVSPIAVPSWEVNDAYKGIIYSKTATFIQTIKAHLGADAFKEMMMGYFEEHQFTHPRKADFIEVVQNAFAKSNSHLAPTLDAFLEQALDGTQVCDYAVTRIINESTTGDSGWFGKENDLNYKAPSSGNAIMNVVRAERKGDFILPVEIKFQWEDGTSEILVWSGRETVKIFQFEKNAKLVSAEIDPSFLVRLDIDRNNNSYTIKPETMGVWKYALRSVFWLQNALQATSFLM